jgi:hypothetical protein
MTPAQAYAEVRILAQTVRDNYGIEGPCVKISKLRAIYKDEGIKLGSVDIWLGPLDCGHDRHSIERRGMGQDPGVLAPGVAGVYGPRRTLLPPVRGGGEVDEP